MVIVLAISRAVCISCRPRVDRGIRILIYFGRHKWMAPKYKGHSEILIFGNASHVIFSCPELSAKSPPMGVSLTWTGEGSKPSFSCGHRKWMTPKLSKHL